MSKKESAQQKTIHDRIDDAIAFFSPMKALRRKQARNAYNMLSTYDGADYSRIRKSWFAGSDSADATLINALPILRQRSRDLNRNDPHAAGITATMDSNIIGTGIRVQSRVDRDTVGMDDDAASRYQKAAERAFQRWAPHADAGERMNFYEIQSLVVRQIMESGEALVMPVMKKSLHRPYMLCLDIIEPDRLGNPYGRFNNKNVRMGVELGDHGEPVAYHVRKTHPGELSKSGHASGENEYQRIPARNSLGRKNIFHLYFVKRPGQTRGEPFFAPVMTYFKDKADYFEAEVVAARVAACFAAIVHKNDPRDAATGRAAETNENSQRIEALEPGMVEYLEPGEDITQINPMRQGSQLDPFIVKILQAICAGLNLPYEVVSKDFSKTNFAGARAAILEARRYFEKWQEFIARNLCQPTYEMILEEAFLNRDLPITDFYQNKYEYCRSRWMGQGWSWVDPIKDVQASILAISNNLTTVADECARLGKDWEDVFIQREREEAMAEEMGIKSDGDPNTKVNDNQEKKQAV